MASRLQTLFSLVLVAAVAGCGAEQRGGDDVSGEPAPTERAPGASVAADDGAPGDGPPGEGSRVALAEGVAGEPAPPPPPPPIALPDDPPTFERPEHVRGIYVNAWSAGSAERMESLIRLARGTEINAFVIDVKDVSGRISYSSGVTRVRETGAVGEPAIRDPVGLLRRLSEEGIYPIARIVIARDPVLARARPDLAIQHRDGGVWTDHQGDRWLDPYRREVWTYHVELAAEALRMGFPEIQWDYVRFPDGPAARRARAAYPDGGRPDPAVIRGFLRYAREELEAVNPDVQITADVFGVTTRGGDVGIGQRWRDFIDVLDVALPMVYPSHYWRGSYGVEHPNAEPYHIVRSALRDALWNSRQVEGAGRVRPWLQDFDLGEPVYGVPEVRAQMWGAYDAGVREWIFWNPGSRYTRDAFAPAGGYADGEEPWIRVGGRVVPVSRREEAMAAYLDSLEAVRLAETEADSVGRGRDADADADSLTLKERAKPRVLHPDSLRQAIDSLLRSRDTTSVRKDTIPGG